MNEAQSKSTCFSSQTQLQLAQNLSYVLPVTTPQQYRLYQNACYTLNLINNKSFTTEM